MLQMGDLVRVTREGWWENMFGIVISQRSSTRSIWEVFLEEKYIYFSESDLEKLNVVQDN
jgi:hypothetical protein